MTATDPLTSFVFLAVILVPVIGAYFAPSLVAGQRKVPNQKSIFVINLLLGWTLAGWVVALAMALRDVPTTPTVEPTGPAPGWYNDPNDPTRQRWWDGSDWTSTSRPVMGGRTGP